ncbi:MAG: hypothetical protein A3J35_00055 [Gammaproteobacteria bacterium RIFCSPLOWO2_02_FULL_52_10]|nr:MAG: hypothetical protein A3J35_00055 [Gammaproteobacteria bacterium RIFCSPLOWO2_02_FULL_52_10]OGT83388.1 MAG: hypothetical protein A3G96_05480 [Gammaproteobacteria bacterium RIFCSPLOWO2_12_FULL_52_10]
MVFGIIRLHALPRVTVIYPLAWRNHEPDDKAQRINTARSSQIALVHLHYFHYDESLILLPKQIQ